MSTLSLPNKISQSSVRTVNQRIIRSMYGDGYEQRAAWGLNSTFDEWSLEWYALTRAERDTWFNWYNTVGMVNSFEWTPPEESSPKKFVITQAPSETNAGSGKHYTITVSIKEVKE